MTTSICLYSYRFGQFELQPCERRLLAAGVPAVVGPRAFDVLVALVERAGHLVTKEELFSRVWPKLIVEDANLHVQVSALRKILGPAAITTVSGQGYRFTLELTHELIDSAPPGAVTRSIQPQATFTGSERELADVLTNVEAPVPEFRETVVETPYTGEGALRRQAWARFRRWPWLAGVALILIAVGVCMYVIAKTTPWTTAIAEAPTLSIAILPLTATADEQLAATLTPEISAAFWRNARSASLASPEIVAAYQGKHVDARTIGHELNVRYVAEGEIRRAGGTRLLSARLINAFEVAYAQYGPSGLRCPRTRFPAPMMRWQRESPGNI